MIVSRLVPLVVIQSSCQHINVMMDKVKQCKNKGENFSCTVYVHGWPRGMPLIP